MHTDWVSRSTWLNAIGNLGSHMVFSVDHVRFKMVVSPVGAIVKKLKHILDSQKYNS